MTDRQSSAKLTVMEGDQPMDRRAPLGEERVNGMLPANLDPQAAADLLALTALDLELGRPEGARPEGALLERARLEGALMVSRTVAYEFQTALTPVVGFAALLERHPLVQAEPQLALYARRLLDSADTMAAQVQRLHLLQRIVLVEEPDGFGAVEDLPFLDLALSTAAAAEPLPR